MKKSVLGYSLIALLIGVFAVTTYNALVAEETVVTGARVKANANIGVYSDSRCTKPLSAIDWGNLKAGDIKTRAIYIKNTGTAKVTLNLSTSDWLPTEASQSITITWNRQKTALSPNKIIQATLKLTVNQSTNAMIESFAFSVIISGAS